MKRLTFAVIIPTLNEENYIGPLLKSIQEQPLKPKEIFVIDAKSKDKTIKRVQQYPNIKIFKMPPNIAEQRNMGGKKASADILYFLDADTILPQDFFQSTIKLFTSPNDLKITCPYYLPYKSNLFIFLIYLFFNLMFFLLQKISSSGAGSSIIMSKKLFTQLKGFNPEVKFEDIELIRRSSRIANFSMTANFIWVSDRRFKKDGLLKTTTLYLILSVAFLFNQFNWTPFSYSFGTYSKHTSSSRL